MTEGTHVSVLIPVLNEKQNIARLITLFDELFGSAVHSPSQKKETLHPRDNINLSLIFVDDGSEDGTCEIIAEMANSMNLDIHLLSRGKQRGGNARGSALLEGLKFAVYNLDSDLIVEMDGDLSHRPEELSDHLDFHLSNKNVVLISSKFESGSETVQRPIGRVLISFFATKLMKLIIDRRISDWTNGYRSYTKECADIILQTDNLRKSPLFLTETLSIWLAQGVKVSSIKSLYVGRGEGESKLGVTDLLKGFVGVCGIALRYRRGLYTSAKRDW
jgi:dolichol-phosphate mannosyltransferase